ncbi:hypothetical protein BSKO_09929 [Bryopsis sp. KO-2023]|nr:hypothetical protein BSKO_09929 [Bryopsis sp. KO-2023]
MAGTFAPLSNQARWMSTSWRFLKPKTCSFHAILNRGARRDPQHQVCRIRSPVALATSMHDGESTASPENSGEPVLGEHTQYCVVNFYHLVDIQNPQQAVEDHKVWMTDRDIKGRIYLSTQGINAQYSGAWDDAVAYPKWLEQQREFQGLRWNCEPAQEHLFPKLRLQFKSNLVHLSGGMAGLPITSPEARATPLSPPEWKDMLKNAINLSDKASESPVVLDIRNGYEWDAGHFEGASRPAEDSFCQTPVGTSDEDVPEFLEGKDPDAPIMMYCTGGIRCDVYSTFLRKKGFKNLYSLEGGVQKYFKEEGGDHWEGSLFVFDGRLAIPPEPESNAKGPLPAAIPCELCGESSAELPHMNCANVDCNKLFVACPSCKVRAKGCCCEQCIDAPRLLRPMLESGMYGKWGNYAKGSRRSRTRHLIEMEEESTEPNGKPSTRRKRSSARKQMKRDEMKEEKQRQKAMAKAAMDAKENESDSSPTVSLREGLSSLQIKS